MGTNPLKTGIAVILQNKIAQQLCLSVKTNAFRNEFKLLNDSIATNKRFNKAVTPFIVFIRIAGNMFSEKSFHFGPNNRQAQWGA